MARRGGSRHHLQSASLPPAILAADGADGGGARWLTESIEELVVMGSEAREAIHSLSQISSADREILMLAAWEEMTVSQIAESLAISPTAANKRLERARRRFARTLRPCPAQSGARSRLPGMVTSNDRRRQGFRATAPCQPGARPGGPAR